MGSMSPLYGAVERDQWYLQKQPVVCNRSLIPDKNAELIRAECPAEGAVLPWDLKHHRVVAVLCAP